MQALQKLSETDKEIFYVSLVKIQHDLNNIVRRFYDYLLETDAAVLFKHTDMEKQQRMFHVSIAFIIAHVDNPAVLQNHMNMVVETHKKYGVINKYVPMFIDSLISALSEFLDRDERAILIWSSIIYEIMGYFNEQLSTINLSHFHGLRLA